MEPADELVLPEVVEAEDVVLADSTVVPSAGPLRVAPVEDDGDAISVASEELEINLQEKLHGIIPLGDLSVEQKLAVWYSWIPPVQSDAIEELGGNDSCLVSAEGLILRFGCGMEYHEGSFMNSPQFLKLLYSIEKFMADLIDLGVVNLTLVYFNCLKGLLCKQHPNLWAFREALRLHTTLACDRFASITFEDWSQPKYSQYMEGRNPFVFLLEDGGALKPSCSIFQQGGDEDDEEDTEGETSAPKEPDNDSTIATETGAAEHGLYPLYSLMLDTTCRGVNVSMLYEMEKNGRRIKTFTALPQHAVPSLHDETLSKVIEMMKAQCEALSDHEASEHFLPVGPEWPTDKPGSALPLRLALYRNCGLETGLLPDEETGQAEPWSVLFYKCLLIQDLLLRCIPLKERPTRVSHFTEPDIYQLTLEFFMVKVMSLLTNLLDKSAPDLLKSSFMECRREVADLFDERVLRSILFCLVDHYREDPTVDFDANFFGINAEWSQVLESVWSQMTEGTGGNFFPIKLDEIADSDFDVIECTPQDLMEPVADSADLPKVLPFENDFMTVTLKLKQGLLPGLTQLEDQDEDAGVGVSDWQPKSDFMLHDFIIEANKKEDRIPHFILKLSGEEKERELKKFRQRRLQESKAYSRNINKYFGGLDRLHLPIVLIGGKAPSGHPWVKDDQSLTTVTTTAADEQSPSKKEKESTTKKDGKKVSKKAAEIIAKNQQKIADKRAAKEEDMSASLYSQMLHLFKKKISRVNTFHDAFLTLLLGPRNAQDSTVLEDFPAIRTVLTLPANRIKFLTDVAEKLMDLLEHTWKKRAILETGQLRDLLRVIGLIFRYVQVTVDKHVTVMSASQIKVFQSLLLMLGFERSARATFDFWASHQWRAKMNAAPAASKAEAAEAAPPPKKGGKPGAGQGKKNAVAAAVTKTTKDVKGSAQLEKQKASYMKKLESDGLITRCIRLFDFAVYPGREATFQVNYLGPDMERTLGSVIDPRVSFLPDYWQKRLIDIVDTQQSSLVVAPTASGKTFAAYYAMDCVLRYDNESCVMFISPTRALGLQVEAEVLARFSAKAYPAGCKTKLVGNLLEDRNDNWNNCQVLITVASCAETLLSSTSAAAQDFRSKLKYAILDEIHCIGDEKQGKQWETLIQLLPCPFIALSATVGNEGAFSEWLAKAQSVVPQQQVNFIKHNERYADLQTLYYASTTHSLYNLNPLLCLDYERLKNGSLTSDFHLIPEDAAKTFDQLADTLMKKQVSWTKNEEQIVTSFVSQYTPEQFFLHTRSITKKQYRMWLTSILLLVEKFAGDGLITANDFASLWQQISNSTPIGVGGPEPWWKEDDATASSLLFEMEDHKPKESATTVEAEAEIPLGQELTNAQSVHSDHYFNDPAEFLRLIRDMEARRLMPALVFNFNRAFASRLFYKVASKLIDDHYDKFYGTPEAAIKTKLINKKRQDEYKAMLVLREQAEKWKSLSKEQREEQGIDEQTFAELTGPLPPPPTDIAEDHDAEFFLTDKRTYASSHEEFAGILQMCRLDRLVKTKKVPTILVESLRRGLGLYHDALHREYRRAVELLFRMRYLRIVVSDMSLSMGVNMPCKSTVFAGDSALLTPLLYRQTCGRAGRRGFDSLGHVIFWQFPFKKIRRLLCSKLPVLSGGYPVKPTTTITAMAISQASEERIMTEHLSSGVGNMETVVKKIDESRENAKKVFTAPLYMSGAPKTVTPYLDDNIRTSLRFAVDLVRRLKLFQLDGSEGAFTRIVTALSEDEPGNLFFVYAILKGILVELSQQPLPATKPLDEDFLNVLAFAIKRRKYTYSIVRRFELASISKELQGVMLPVSATGTNCSPLLPPLQSTIEKLAAEFDSLVLHNVKERARAMALTRADYEAQEGLLPLSDINYFELDESLPADGGKLIGWWKGKALLENISKALSPFMLLCGADLERLKTPDELIASLRRCIFIERNLIPQLLTPLVDVKIPGVASPVPLRLLNSYAADVLINRSLRSIIEFNDIPAAEAYFIIMGLRESLARLHGALVAQQNPADVPLSPSRAICARVGAVKDSCDKLFKQIRQYMR